MADPDSGASSLSGESRGPQAQPADPLRCQPGSGPVAAAAVRVTQLERRPGGPSLGPGGLGPGPGGGPDELEYYIA
jgi:hypothetical protein